MLKKKPLIAIVDDDESIRQATEGLMRSLGFRAKAFSSGEDFLTSSDVRATACLVADVNMPGMSGLELHQRLWALGLKLPVILITAYPADSIRRQALAAGVTCYLAKPFAEDDLLDCIRCALKDANL